MLKRGQSLAQRRAEQEQLAAQDIPFSAADLHLLESKELLKIRATIDARLGITTGLAGVNMETELLAQLAHVKLLQQEANDEATPANQKAQTANTVQACLIQLTRLLVETHTAERFKALEQAMITAMQDQPEAVKLAFFNEYERVLATIQEG